MHKVNKVVLKAYMYVRILDFFNFKFQFLLFSIASKRYPSIINSTLMHRIYVHIPVLSLSLNFGMICSPVPNRNDLRLYIILCTIIYVAKMVRAHLFQYPSSGTRS